MVLIAASTFISCVVPPFHECCTFSFKGVMLCYAKSKNELLSTICEMHPQFVITGILHNVVLAVELSKNNPDLRPLSAEFTTSFRMVQLQFASKITVTIRS